MTLLDAVPTPFVPDSLHEDLLAVTAEVWTAFLGDDALLPSEDETTVPTGFAASVTVTGGWEGHVILALTSADAEHVTRAMLGLDEAEECTETDVADAVGELVNMIGGNVKSLLPGPSQLSLPLVAAGAFAHRSETVEIERVSMRHVHPSLGPLAVTVSVHTARPTENRTPA